MQMLEFSAQFSATLASGHCVMDAGNQASSPKHFAKTRVSRDPGEAYACAGW